MNAIVKTKGQVFKEQLTKLRPNIATALPSHISVEKFERVALTAVQTNPDLLNKDHHSLFLSCQKAAADGLLPDGREGALVVFGDKVQWMPMVAGLMKLARNSGEIASIQAQIVYEGEKFAVILGDEERIEHERDMRAVDTAKPVAAYAVAKLKNGETVREVMTWKQVMKRKNVSRSKNGPWATWEEEMARKTVIRALMKRLPSDTDRDHDKRLESAVERVVEDSVIDGIAEAPETAEQPPAPASRLDAIESQITDAEVVQQEPPGLWDEGGDSILPASPLADLRDMMAPCKTMKALDETMRGATWKAALDKLTPEQRETLRADVAAKQAALRGAG